MTAVRRINGDPKPVKVWRGSLMYVLVMPLLPAAVLALIEGEVLMAIARAMGFGLGVVGATLIRRGIRLEMERVRRRLRRRTSTVPYRMIGAGMLSAGVFVVAWLGIKGDDYSLIVSVLFAAVVFAGCWLYYEFDPTPDDSNIVAVGITTEELVELLDEAEGRLSAIETAGQSINNTEFRDRLRRIVSEARAILVTIEEDPVDARRARKFLKVYLEGAQQVTEGYARMHRHGDTPVLEDNFRRVLTTIETVIGEQQERLQQNDVTDLDVKIEVLQMQLEKEGVT